jgi:hypothetical protein
MKKWNVILFAVVFIGLLCANAQDLNSLRSWIGKYPTYDKVKPQQKKIELPEIQKPLKQLLSSRDFKHLTKELSVESQIQLIKNYLVVDVCYPDCCPCDHAILAINLENSGIHVGFYEHRGTKEAIRWFNSQPEDNLDELPKEILDEFLPMYKH